MVDRETFSGNRARAVGQKTANTIAFLQSVLHRKRAVSVELQLNSNSSLMHCDTQEVVDIGGKLRLIRQ